MKILFASDIHGSAYYCRRLLDIYKETKASRMVILGDILYHGPRNDLPKEYAPKEVIAMLNPLKDQIYAVRGNCDTEVDILIHGHTHVLKAQQMDGYILLNPGSVSIPKEGNPATYAVLENSIFTIKDFDGNTVREMRLP